MSYKSWANIGILSCKEQLLHSSEDQQYQHRPPCNHNTKLPFFKMTNTKKITKTNRKTMSRTMTNGWLALKNLNGNHVTYWKDYIPVYNLDLDVGHLYLQCNTHVKYICQILEGLYQSTDYIDVGCSPIFDQALSSLANQIVAHIILIACK